MLKYPYAKHCFDDGEISAVLDVLSSGWVARGPKITSFESKFSTILGYKYSIACTNGSAALEISLRSAGIGPGDEVIVPTLSWASSATSISMVGAQPVFADINPISYCICPQSIQNLITPRTKAIIVVHFAGVPADMLAIWHIASENKILVIEDCAHAIGGSYLDHTPIGSSSLTYSSTFSLHPAKNITTAEGGIITTAHQDVALNLALYRSAGIQRNEGSPLGKAFYDISVISSNYHVTDIQAAIGMVQLDKLQRFVDIRRAQISRYNSNLAINESIGLHQHPPSSAANLYITLLPIGIDRDAVCIALNSLGIGSYYHYPLIHASSVYSCLSFACPNAEHYARRALTLPLGPHLAISDIDIISVSLIGLLKSLK